MGALDFDDAIAASLDLSSGGAVATPDRTLAPANGTKGMVSSHWETEVGGVPVKLVNGQLPGPIGEAVYRVPLAQLAVDDGHTLRRAYDPTADTDLPKLVASIQAAGGVLEPLVATWRGETVEVDGATVPLYRVRLGVRRYHAAVFLGRAGSPVVATVPITLPDPSTEGQFFLAALTRQQQHKRLSLLDQALGVARLMDEYHYTQDQLAQYLGLDQSKISNLRAAASEPPAILDYMARDALTLQHVTIIRRHCPTKAADRELAAQYAVQTGASAKKIAHICAACWPPKGVRPTAALRHDAASDTVSFVPLEGAGATLKLTPDRSAVEHYWQRGRPVFASTKDVRELARQHPVRLLGDGPRPQVVLDDLHLDAVARRLESHGDAAPLADVERELLGLLEAIHMAIRSPRAAPTATIVEAVAR